MDSVKESTSVNRNSNRLIDALDLVETNCQEKLPSNSVIVRICASNKAKDYWNFRSKNKEAHGEKGEIKKKCKMITNGLWDKFARTTTGHGFARMMDENDPMKLRIFWGIAVMFLTIGLFTSVFIISYDSLVVRGLRREFIIRHNLSLNLPDIHICDTSLFNVTILKEMGFNTTLASYMALAISPHLASHGLKENHGKRQELEQEYRRLMENRTMQQVFDKAILKCEDIILGCTHYTIAYSSKQCCNHFFGTRRYLTDLATLCFSTHNQPPLEEQFGSQIYGFTVYLKMNPHSRFEFDPTIISSNVASRRGIIYAVSDRITTVNPAISTSGYYTTPGSWTSVSISLSRTDNSELADGILSPYSCALASSNLDLPLLFSYEAYSERNCFFATARSVMEAKLNCSCFYFNFKRNKFPCEPKVMIDAYSSEIAAAIKEKTYKCPKDCISDDYHVSSSTTQLHLGNLDDMLMGEVHDDNMVHSAIHFFYPSFTYTIIKNHPQSVVKWLTEVGGSMSLFVGASFVTLIEFTVLGIRYGRLYFRGGRPAG